MVLKYPTGLAYIQLNHFKYLSLRTAQVIISSRMLTRIRGLVKVYLWKSSTLDFWASTHTYIDMFKAFIRFKSYSAGISRFHCDQVYTRNEVNSSNSNAMILRN